MMRILCGAGRDLCCLNLLSSSKEETRISHQLAWVQRSRGRGRCETLKLLAIKYFFKNGIRLLVSIKLIIKCSKY